MTPPRRRTAPVDDVATPRSTSSISAESRLAPGHAATPVCGSPRTGQSTHALSFGAALTWVLLAGFASQLVGGLVSVWVIASQGDASGAMAPALIASAAALLLVVVLVPTLARVPLAGALGLRAAPLDVFLCAAGATILLGPTGDALMHLAARMFPHATLGTIDTLNDAAAAVPLLLAWPAFALLPGVSEELLFRGILQRSARRGWFAVIVSGVVFALFHVDPHHVVGVLPLGLFLAWAGERAGTWVTVVAHVANNTAAVLVARTDMIDRQEIDQDPWPWPWVALSLALFACAAGYLARRTRVASATLADSAGR